MCACCFLLSTLLGLGGIYEQGLSRVFSGGLQIRRCVERIDPDLAEHIANVDILETAWLPQWIMTLFAKRMSQIGKKNLEMLWDLFFREGWTLVVRASVMMLLLSKQRLLQCEDCPQALPYLTEEIWVELDFVDVCRMIKTSLDKNSRRYISFEELQEIEIEYFQEVEKQKQAEKEELRLRKIELEKMRREKEKRAAEKTMREENQKMVKESEDIYMGMFQPIRGSLSPKKKNTCSDTKADTTNPIRTVGKIIDGVGNFFQRAFHNLTKKRELAKKNRSTGSVSMSSKRSMPSPSGKWVLVYRQTAGLNIPLQKWKKYIQETKEGNNYSILEGLDNFRTKGGFFKFKMSWPLEDTNQKRPKTFNVWLQSENPIESDRVGEYVPIDINHGRTTFAGLFRYVKTEKTSTEGRGNALSAGIGGEAPFFCVGYDIGVHGVPGPKKVGKVGRVELFAWQELDDEDSDVADTSTTLLTRKKSDSNEINEGMDEWDVIDFGDTMPSNSQESAVMENAVCGYISSFEVTFARRKYISASGSALYLGSSDMDATSRFLIEKSTWSRDGNGIFLRSISCGTYITIKENLLSITLNKRKSMHSVLRLCPSSNGEVTLEFAVAEGVYLGMHPLNGKSYPCDSEDPSRLLFFNPIEKKR